MGVSSPQCSRDHVSPHPQTLGQRSFGGRGCGSGTPTRYQRTPARASRPGGRNAAKFDARWATGAPLGRARRAGTASRGSCPWLDTTSGRGPDEVPTAVGAGRCRKCRRRSSMSTDSGHRLSSSKDADESAFCTRGHEKLWKPRFSRSGADCDSPGLSGVTVAAWPRMIHRGSRPNVDRTDRPRAGEAWHSRASFFRVRRESTVRSVMKCEFAWRAHID